MNLSSPLPWRYVPAGAVVLLDGVPRTVLIMGDGAPSDHPRRSALVEGLPPFTVFDDHTVQLVLLDTDDAVATLAAAGLHPELIKENPAS